MVRDLRLFMWGLPLILLELSCLLRLKFTVTGKGVLVLLQNGTIQDFFEVALTFKYKPGFI